MPALDQCHPQIVRALQKDGWSVEDKPVRLSTEERTVFIDIQANRQHNGQGQSMLLAEVKCFSNRQTITTEVYAAISQYIIYRMLLSELQLNIPLYLAIPELVYHTIFDSTLRHVVSDNQIKLLIVNLEDERIIQWIE